MRGSGGAGGANGGDAQPAQPESDAEHALWLSGYILRTFVDFGLLKDAFLLTDTSEMWNAGLLAYHFSLGCTCDSQHVY